MADQDLIQKILNNAERDGINLSSLPFLQEALDSITILSPPTSSIPVPDFSTATRIDTHTHPIPSWFRDLSPLAAGRPTPTWDPLSHLHFMSSHGIAHSILSISTPQANAYPDYQERTIALARLLNEYCAAIVRAYPARFSFLAVTCLPYVNAAIREVEYALDELGAVGVAVLTNHEGLYTGDEKFKPFWTMLNDRKKNEEKEIVFIHPTDPVIRVGGELVDSRPSPLRSGLGEFYFETARAISSITASRTIHEYPRLYWRISHGAGAFPCIADRFLLGFPEEAEEARRIYATRFWYDSAGPVYPRQIKGLLAYDIPISQMVFGTDYPYGIGFWDVDANIAGLSKADFLQDDEKQAIFHTNSKRLWEGRIPGF